MDNKISCAFIATYYGPYYSNFVASIIEFEKKMQATGNNVIYIFPKECEQFEWIGELEKLNKKIYYVLYNPHSLDIVREFRFIFKKENINIIYSHMCGWDIRAHLAAPSIPIIWHMRMNVNVQDKSKRIKNWIKYRVIGSINTYNIAVSYPVADAINSLHPKNKCVAIPNSLDFSRLRPKGGYNANKSGIKKLLIFGWAPIVKGLDTALSACEMLNKDTNRVQLVVSAQEKTYDYLNEKYGEKQYPSWIELVPPTSDIASLYEQVDMMVSASRSEGFSFSLAEAIYSGLPVIFSDIPGTNWAEEFRCSYQFRTAIPESLAQSIDDCCNTYISSDDIIYNQNLMKEKYSMNAWVNRVYSYIVGVVDETINKR